jgi:hypothetical protein
LLASRWPDFYYQKSTRIFVMKNGIAGAEIGIDHTRVISHLKNHGKGEMRKCNTR